MRSGYKNILFTFFTLKVQSKPSIKESCRWFIVVIRHCYALLLIFFFPPVAILYCCALLLLYMVLASLCRAWATPSPVDPLQRTQTLPSLLGKSCNGFFLKKKIGLVLSCLAAHSLVCLVRSGIRVCFFQNCEVGGLAIFQKRILAKFGERYKREVEFLGFVRFCLWIGEAQLLRSHWPEVTSHPHFSLSLGTLQNIVRMERML